MKFFSGRKAASYEQYTPEAFRRLRDNLILRGLELLILQDLTHIPSVLLQLVANPESSLNVSNKWKNVRAELNSARIGVVSFTQWSSLVSRRSVEMPLILVFCRTAVGTQFYLFYILIYIPEFQLIWTRFLYSQVLVD